MSSVVAQGTGRVERYLARFEAQAIDRRHDWAMGIAVLASVFFLAFAWLGLRR